MEESKKKLHKNAISHKWYYLCLCANLSNPNYSPRSCSNILWSVWLFELFFLFGYFFMNQTTYEWIIFFHFNLLTCSTIFQFFSIFVIGFFRVWGFDFFSLSVSCMEDTMTFFMLQFEQSICDSGRHELCFWLNLVGGRFFNYQGGGHSFISWHREL